MVSHRVHSRYTRRLHDLAWAGAAVRWQLQVRRFRCQYLACSQQLFAERLLELVAPAARRTTRLTKLLHQIALMAGATAGSRLSTLLVSGTSTSTLLRILRAAPLPAPGTPQVVGLDEWAWRKGRTYGTIIVALEDHRVLDLLPDCRSEHVAAWRRRYPRRTVISRDRSGPFATAATQGAPHATQVADRFHLLKNLTETLLRVFEPHCSELNNVRRIGDQLTAAPLTEAPPGHRPSAATQPSAGRTQRHLRYQQVRHVYASGMTHTRIAHQMGLSCKTVRRGVRATAYPAHPGAKRRGRPSGRPLDPCKPYLLKRFQVGCHNARRL
ncbi:MAG: ISL3 family transposase [Chloroflexi bacterium AL-N15]|nr:ISL3 family transposase [Chloroflexi bacterium AL-N15]